MKQFDEALHKQRHEALHKALDELVADFLEHNPNARPSTTSVLDLMQWSAREVAQPTPDKRDTCTCNPGCVSHGEGCPFWVLQL